VATAVKLGMVREKQVMSHVDQIGSVVQGPHMVSGAEEVAESWRRCTAGYRLNPSSHSAPNILTDSELRVSREGASEVISYAQEELDRLYAILRESGYVILLCNSEGIAIHHRGNSSQAEEFKRWGIWLGGVWSEEVEGTNGIGTCITEQRPVVVHRGQHYRTRHTQLSCSGAPIFDAHGKLLSVLDASSFNPQASDQSHALALAAVKVSGRAIEERLFRETFSHVWNIAAAPSDDSGSALLLAVDKDQRVIGADRAARLVFALDDKRLADGVHLSSLYDHDSAIFRQSNGQDIVARLVEANGAREWRAVINPPKSGPGELRILGNSALHARPRISMLGNIQIPESLASRRGGLPPRLARHIREYIESHLGENISIVRMAELAGLSVFHFARAFRQSFGAPPHSYLLRRRIERADHLLKDTGLALSEIALSTGFSDQSHFARHFRRLTGMTPSAARWNQR
jgi:transcriptional regulator of acetoin/glycerol metabolism